MSTELLEIEAEEEVKDERKKWSGYQSYQELGGTINEQDYERGLSRARNTTTLHKTREMSEENQFEFAQRRARISQAENMAQIAGIELHNTEDALDKRTILYAILRSDVQPKDVEYHHSQMSDQSLFVEVLRMLGDVDAVNKMIKAYPNISSSYLKR